VFLRRNNFISFLNSFSYAMNRLFTIHTCNSFVGMTLVSCIVKINRYVHSLITFTLIGKHKNSFLRYEVKDEGCQISFNT